MFQWQALPFRRNLSLRVSYFVTDMEGLLSKKNSKGIWKDRFCKLTSDYFTTYKPKGKKASNEVKESSEILTMDSISVIMNGVLQIKLNKFSP